MKAITPRQQQVLDFVKAFGAENERPPTRAEIAKHFGFKSDNAAQEHLAALARKGFIRLCGNTARGIEVA